MINVNTDGARLFDVAKNILRGFWAIPAFQRDYVWGEDQIQALLDSINNEWPLGTIILIERIGPISHLPLKPKFSNDRHKARYLVLDGAQRCQTLFDMQVTGNLQVFFNVETGKLILMTEKNQDEIMNNPKKYVNWTLAQMYYFLHHNPVAKLLVDGEYNKELVDYLQTQTNHDLVRLVNTVEIAHNYILEHGTPEQSFCAKEYRELVLKKPSEPHKLPTKKPKSLDDKSWEDLKRGYAQAKAEYEQKMAHWLEIDGDARFAQVQPKYVEIGVEVMNNMRMFSDSTYVQCSVTRIDLSFTRGKVVNYRDVLNYFRRINTAGVPVDMDLFEQQVLSILDKEEENE